MVWFLLLALKPTKEQELLFTLSIFHFVILMRSAEWRSRGKSKRWIQSPSMHNTELGGMVTYQITSMKAVMVVLTYIVVGLKWYLNCIGAQRMKEAVILKALKCRCISIFRTKE